MKNNITNIPKLRKNNVLSIFNIIWEKKIITRKQLSSITSITAPTISNIINLLLKKGFIKISDKGDSSGGRQPDLIEFNSSSFYVIGITFKKYMIQARLADAAGTEILNHQFDIDIEDEVSRERILNKLENVIDGLLNNCEKGIRKKIVCAGVSFPGSVDSDKGNIISSNILAHLEGLNFVDFIEKKYSFKTYIENDASLFALNEYWFGKAKKVKYLIAVLAGVGIGSGFLVNGEIYRGHNNAAGQVGHTVIDLNGRKCYCGNYGCLETLANYYAIFTKFQSKIKFSQNKYPEEYSERRFSEDAVEEILEYAKSGDKLALSIIEQAGNYLGIAILNLINILNPDKVIIGGGYYKVKDIILEQITDFVRLRGRLPVRDTVIEFTDFGSDAMIHGAITLGIKKFLESGFAELLDNDFSGWQHRINDVN
jgi:N-acetylglucosamine repressor